MNFTNIIKRFPKTCQTYWDCHWSKGKVLFRTKTGEEMVEVTTAFNTITLPKDYKLKDTCDNIALETLRYVVSKISYEPDSARWGKAEYWQTSAETLKFQTGDCEDMAILIMDLMRAAGIPAWRRKMACGVATDPLGNQVGHAYVLYLTDDFVWTSLDAAYYPIESIAHFGKPHSNNIKYGTMWFTTNETYSWHQKSTLFMY